MSPDFPGLAFRTLGDPDHVLACLVFETGRLNLEKKEAYLVRQRKGRVIFEIVATGTAAHAGNDHHKVQHRVGSRLRHPNCLLTKLASYVLGMIRGTMPL